MKMSKREKRDARARREIIRLVCRLLDRNPKMTRAEANRIANAKVLGGK